MRKFDTPEAQWEWWLDRDRKSQTDYTCPLFDGVLAHVDDLDSSEDGREEDG